MDAAGGASATTAFTGRTAWARNVAAPVRSFLSTETGSAVVLLCAAVAALLWANSPWSSSYESVWTTKLSIHLGDAGISQDLRHWVNNGLMTFFFLVVGLEAKREIDTGELRDRQRIAIPVIAAAGGMAVPIAIYLAFNAGGSGAHGFGAAMSTDTAFALGLLALLARRGTRLRVFMLTLAVVDDLVALVVIATVYTDQVSMVPLAIAAGLYGVLFPIRYAPITWRRPVAFLLGVAFWVALYESGIDPVIAGLAVGLAISAYPPSRSDLERFTEQARSFREQPTPELARSTQLSAALAISPNERLQYRFHPWTSFLIVPLFALANAGIHMNGALLEDAVGSPIPLGIVFGYVIGKPLGVFGASWLATRPRLGGLRLALSWPVLGLGGAVAGVGFTVSILVSSLAFHGQRLTEAKLGVLAAALLASLLSWGVGRGIRRIPTPVRARQLAGTAEEILDLSDDVDPGRDHIRGSNDAPVTLVEYGDYQCQYCGQAEVVIRELLDSFGDELGLDVDRFWDELRRHEHAARLAEDVASADASGVAGTPSFFINGRRHQGAYDADALSQAVRRARARARIV